jgi:hypothetical protein
MDVGFHLYILCILQAIVSDEALGKRGIVKVFLPAILLSQ